MTTKPLTTAQMREHLQKAKATKKVMGPNGKPLVVYHGTNQDIRAFENSRLGENTRQKSAIAHYLTESPEEAGEYAAMAAKRQVANAPSHEKQLRNLQAQIKQAENRGDWSTAERLYLQMEDLDLNAINAEPSGHNIVPVHLLADKIKTHDMKNGFDPATVADLIKQAKAEKMHALKLENVYDPVGERAQPFSTNQWIMFDPKRIKSSIGNRGTYDINNPDITKANGGVVKMAKGGQAALDAMRLELLNNEPLDIVGNTKRNLQGAWDVAKNVPGNLKRMAADPVAYAKSLPGPTGDQLMNMLQPGHVGGFAGVIKPQGGNWYKAPHAGPTVEGSISRMKPYQPQEGILPHIKTDYQAAASIDPTGRSAQAIKGRLDEATKRHALNQWVENNLQNYVKKQMGTPEDPIRALHEEGISHLPKDTREGALETDRDTQMRRTEAGYPAEGMAKSDLAKTWENLSDENIWSKPAGEIQRAPQAFKELAEVDRAMRDRQDMVTIKFRNMINKNDALSQAEKETMLRNTPSSEQSKMVGDTELQGLILKRNRLNNLADRENLAINEMNPWAAKLPPETPLHQGVTAGLGFDHVIDILKQDVEAGRIRPEQLNKISITDAVRRTHEFDQEMAKKMAEAQIKSTEGMPVHKEYPEGYKWIELKAKDPVAFEESIQHLQSNPSEWKKATEQFRVDRQKQLEDALKYEGDTMGHCVGGYCPDVLEGRSRIYSLRSPKGEPHVTVETAPSSERDYNMAIEGLKPEQMQQYAAKSKQVMLDRPDLNYGPAGQLAYDELFGKLPERIVQIKGKQNAAPHEQYQPYVQDFVKSGQWSDVGDLRNTGLVRHPETGQYLTPAEMQPIPPEGHKRGGIIYKAEGGNVQPNMAQMRLALNQSQLTNIGANEAPDMSPKQYLSPAQNQDDYPAPDGSATQNGVPIGGVDQDPQQPGQQLVAPPLEPQPPQPGQPQPPAGQQPGMQPGQQPPNVPGVQGQPFANPSPQGMLTAPQGPTPPKGNMLAMTPQGQTMQALGGGQPKPPGMAKGGAVQPTGNAMMDELLRRHYAGERRAFELSQPIQKFDQEWVDKVMPAYLARRKALVGKKTGGGVKLAPTQDTMRLALTKKKAK